MSSSPASAPPAVVLATGLESASVIVIVIPIPGVAKVPTVGAPLGGSTVPEVGDPANELVMDNAFEFPPEMFCGEDALDMESLRDMDELR